MTPTHTFVERAVVDKLRNGPCFLDDLILALPYCSWADIVMIIDRLSEDGQVLLYDVGATRFQVVPCPQFKAPSLPIPRESRRNNPSASLIWDSCTTSEVGPTHEQRL
jgi:hypothetical protein